MKTFGQLYQTGFCISDSKLCFLHYRHKEQILIFKHTCMGPLVGAHVYSYPTPPYQSWFN